MPPRHARGLLAFLQGRSQLTSDTTAEALEAIKAGAQAGYVFAGMYAFGGVLAYLMARDVTTQAALTGDEPMEMLIAAVLIAGVIAGFAYWSHRRPGVLIPLMLAGWFLVEIVMKMTAQASSTSRFNVGWLILYAIIGGGFVSGVRGGLFLRRARARD